MSRRSASPEREPLPFGADALDPDQDYFMKQTEFRAWLREEKGKYVDELSGEKSRSYFRKFTKRWNSGRLDAKFYNASLTGGVASSSNTAYRWSFAGTGTKKDQAALEEARDSVTQATNQTRRSDGPVSSKGKARIAGPTLPSASEWTEQEEIRRESAIEDRRHSRKREREEDKERVEDLVGPRETGREGMLEKKRLKRESDRQARGEKEDAFVEVREDAIAQRDAARKRMEERRQEDRITKESEGRNRFNTMREKDKANMAFLQALAKERFG
ncbi:hypothetical protein FRB90_008386 [Tulasnella sp. 427]|nr:hypothetical protein FRB90_008386 [Tulasnella sp. 427]